MFLGHSRPLTGLAKHPDVIRRTGDGAREHRWIIEWDYFG
jgi:hypothetical protein